jgi:hypothetical protein
MTQTPRPTRCRQVIHHLIAHGRITDATARHQFGAFRLADAIYRLRGDRADLVPTGKAIITVPREDLNGTPFAEYRLVPETQANA